MDFENPRLTWLILLLNAIWLLATLAVRSTFEGHQVLGVIIYILLGILSLVCLIRLVTWMVEPPR